MKRSVLAIAGLASVCLSGCEAPAEAPEDAVAASDDIERPDEAPVIGADDNLLDLSCADFLATAMIATDEEAGDAAIAAQDEIANGLIWVHGYLFAKNDGEIEVLSQNWMKTTAERVYRTCNTAEDPAAVNLFEVARNEGA